MLPPCDRTKSFSTQGIYIFDLMFNFETFANKTTQVNHMDNELIEKQNRALNILVEAARLAQSRGAFTLEQASLVAEAISVFRPADQGPPPAEAPAAPPAEAPVF